MRAYSTAKIQYHETKASLERAQQENEKLRFQMEALQYSQARSQHNLQPWQRPSNQPSLCPRLTPLSPATVDELAKSSNDMEDWNYDLLITKWNSTVQEDTQSAGRWHCLPFAPLPTFGSSSNSAGNER